MWFTRVSINNPVFATMVMAALCVLGLFSYSQLRVERLPDISPPIVFVAVAYPGASPDAIETELTRPIELALNGIAGVKMIRSNSFEGRSETVVEFQLSADMTRAVQDVRDKVATRAAELPARRQAALRLALRRRQRPADGLSRRCSARTAARASCRCSPTRSCSKRLERVDRRRPGRRRRPDGAPGAHRPRPAAPARLPADARPTSRTALQRANSDMPVGLLTGTKEDAIVRVEGKVRDAKAFADVVVASRNGMVVRLADLGTLVEREREPDSISRVDGVPAISFQVFKQQDANIVETGEAIKDAAEELRKTPAARRRAAPGLRRQRLGRALARRRQAHADRGRAADDRDRLPVPAQLAQHDHHRPDAADRRDLVVHRGLRRSASR